MKHTLFKLFLTVLLLTGYSVCTNANTFTQNGIEYETGVTSGYLGVTVLGSYYSGNVSIPSSVYYNGKTYSVLSIGYQAFRGYTDLTSITIPNSVTSIGRYAFRNCTGLTSVTIPNSVTSIYGNSFSGCSGLSSILVETGNSVYDSRDNCNAIIKTATNELVSGCNNTIIPNSVTSIGSSAFSGCTGLTSVTIPNSVTSIGSYAFYGCTGLTSIEIPYSVTSIGSSAFEGCSGLTKIGISDLAVWCEKGFGRYFSNYSLYLNGEIITDLIIPNSVTSIGDYAFDGCTGLTSVTIPNSVTSIGRYAFYGCTGLTSVTIPNSVTSIESETFRGCPIKKLSINSNAIVSKAYSSDSNLRKIFGDSIQECTIGESVTSIGDYAFDGCTGLTSVTIPNSVTSIGDYAFNGCTGLTSVTIPDSVTSIETYTFNGCTSLTEIIIPNSVTSIGSCAFNGCTDLTEITIPNSVRDIESRVFSGCTSLTSIEIPNSVWSIGDWAFSGCTSLTSIEIPNSVWSIGDWAFFGCTGLTEITIPNSVTSIGERAFTGCTGLTSVTIPKSVTSIGYYAFTGCTGLETVFYPHKNPHKSLPTNLSFLPTNAGTVIFVPINSINAYVRNFSGRSFSTIFDVNATQTMITIKTVSGIDSLAELKDMQVVVGSKTYNATDSIINIADLTPNNEYELTASVDIGEYRWEEAIVVTTGDIGITGNVADVTQTKATLQLTASLGDATNAKRTVNGEEFEGDEVVLTNLTPNKDYTYTYAVQVGDNYTKSVDIAFRTKDISISGEVTNTTQTTATLHLNAEMGDATLVSSEVGSITVEGEDITLTGLVPNTEYTYEYAVLTDGDYRKSSEITFTTKNITVDFDFTAAATTLEINASYDVGDATLTSASFDAENQVSKIEASGLEPNRTYSYTYYVTTEEGGTVNYTARFSTEPLELKTTQAKVVSVGNLLVSVESNIKEDEDVNVGFEWRRYDWPDEIASSTGAAFIYEGKIEGSIRNLNADKFWKIRPYFISKSGTHYYGEWLTTDPSNTSYFEPTVHTYARTEIEGNTATVKGYALGGSDEVKEQGFKYWEIIPSSSSPEYPQATEVPAYAKTVTASGQLMTAELQDLQYEMEYRYVAFVTSADGKTYYGEEQSLKIDDPTGIQTAEVETPATGDVKVYTLTGALIYSGSEDEMQLEKGLYIIRHSDGKTRKIIIR